MWPVIQYMCCQVTELEALNFSLEEKLVELEERLEREGGGEGVKVEEVDGVIENRQERRRRGYTLVEATLAAKDKVHTCTFEDSRVDSPPFSLFSPLCLARRSLSWPESLRPWRQRGWG